MPRKKKIKVNTPQKEKFIPQEDEINPTEDQITPTEDQITPTEDQITPTEDQITPTEDQSLKQLGQKIREARIAKNLSLESVSGHLHIAVKILEAIEDGDPKKGPKLVFLRGLVRTYCNYLGIDNTDIIYKIEKLLESDALGEQQLKTLKPVIEIRESHPIRNIVVVLVLVTGGYLLYSIYSHQITSFLTQDNNTQSESTIVVVEDNLAEIKKITVTDDRISKSSPSSKQSKLKYAPSKKFIPEQVETSSMEYSNQGKNDITLARKTNEDTVYANSERAEVLTNKDKTSEKFDIESEIILADPNQTNPNELPQPEIEQDIREPLTLEVEASEGTWISISVDGNVAKDIRLSTDEIHQWEAKKEYILTLGNTHAVRILLNGREIETNRTHQLLRDWIIDKSFLP